MTSAAIEHFTPPYKNSKIEIPCSPLRETNPLTNLITHQPFTEQLLSRRANHDIIPIFATTEFHRSLEYVVDAQVIQMTGTL